MSEENKNPIRTPVKYSQESRMVLDANGDMVCHFMWNTHRPHWDKVGATAQIICALINADYSRVTALESDLEYLNRWKTLIESAPEFEVQKIAVERFLKTDGMRPFLAHFKTRIKELETENERLSAEVEKWKRLAGKKAI